MMNGIITAFVATTCVLGLWFWFWSRPKFTNKHVVVDVETTGTDPSVHEILEIAIVAMDGSVLFHSKISPQQIETASPRALEINAFDPVLWEGAPRWQAVAPKICQVLEGKQLVGHNVHFDKGFIFGMFSRYGLPVPDVMYQFVDTSTLIFEHLTPIWTDPPHDRLGLATVMKVFWPELDCHRALGDAEGTRRLALKLAHASLLSKLWWMLLWRLRRPPKTSSTPAS